MPVFNQAEFVSRAIESLLAQSEDRWELIAVDDGSSDGSAAIIRRYTDDQRLRIDRSVSNRGLGWALNRCLCLARAPLIAYLPADDIYYPEHLASLVAALDEHPEAALAYSGVRYDYNRRSSGQIDGYPLQLVQMLHRRSGRRWTEREQLTTDDLDRMYWTDLRREGEFVATGAVTCEWVSHPRQRHKAIRESSGGLNTYRGRYGVAQPLRFQSSMGNAIDEVEHYRRFRERPGTPKSDDGLKILLVGELAYNPERVLALEERGHDLFGLWMPEPSWFNTVGPVPFGHVTDIPRPGWRDAVARLKPDIIYALLNWQAVPFAHEVMRENPGIPFVWHFKEGPFICLEHGTWSELSELTLGSDGQIYSTPEQRDWFRLALPGSADDDRSMVLDGDLPKREWATRDRSPLLSEQDGELHTVVPGRPIGLHVSLIAELARLGIHVHFYGDFSQALWREWIERARTAAPRHLHLHPQVDQEGWVREFSKYDAGWLHFFESSNEGDLRRANWDDLNCPSRLPALALAGVPLLQRDNRHSVVATQSLVRSFDAGVCFTEMEELRESLLDRRRMAELRENLWTAREQFTFDAHTDRLVEFFRKVIQAHSRHERLRAGASA
jgi:glycosyltransferase involved in cell wall biosynthesis